MSVTVADHIRWMGQMTQGARYGATAGDSFHQGTYDYSTSRPYPNGLPVVPGGMSDCEAGKRMIDKARRDSAEITREHRAKEDQKQRDAESVDVESTIVISLTADTAVTGSFEALVEEFQRQIDRFTFLKEESIR